MERILIGDYIGCESKQVKQLLWEDLRERELRMHVFLRGGREVAYFGEAAPSRLTYDCCGRASVQYVYTSIYGMYINVFRSCDSTPGE